MPSLHSKKPSIDLKFSVRIKAITSKRAKGKAKAKTPKPRERASTDSSAGSSSSSRSFKRIFVKSKFVSPAQIEQFEDLERPSQQMNGRIVAATLEQLQNTNPALPGPSDRCPHIERQLQWRFIQEAKLPFTYEIYHEQLHALEKAHQNRKRNIKMRIRNAGGKARGEGRLDAGLATVVERLRREISTLNSFIASYPQQAGRADALARGKQVLSALESSTEHLDRFESELRKAVTQASCLENRKEAPFMLEAAIKADAIRLSHSVRGCIVLVSFEAHRLRSEIEPQWKQKIRWWT